MLGSIVQVHASCSKNHLYPPKKNQFNSITYCVLFPTNVICFTWIAIQEACLTQDNLIKRSFQFPNRCYMCRQDAETTNHLLLHCSVVYDIWCMFYSIFGLSWVMPQITKEAVEVWSSWKVGKSIKKIWNMIPACIFWIVWAERNRRCFDGLSTSHRALKAKCFLLLFCLCKLSPVNSPELFLDFVSSLELQLAYSGANPHLLYLSSCIFLMPLMNLITSSKKKKKSQAATEIN